MDMRQIHLRFYVLLTDPVTNVNKLEPIVQKFLKC